ncbi:MAG TPA: MFS transporter, partial [Acidimicrobiia bacterium]|nr:MFS transporter [Acidimicrobiia bacterium]
MPLRHQARLDAPVDAVRAAVVDVLGASATAAGNRVEGTVESAARGPMTVVVTLETDGAGTRLTVTGEDPPHVPWFQWFSGPALRHATKRVLRWVVDAIEAHRTGAPPPEQPRPNRLAPPVPFDERQTRSVATACAIALVTGTGASLFGTNIDFIGDSFDASDQALGIAGAVTRVGVVIGLVLTAMADRRGRRLLLIVSVAGVSLSSLVSAVAPNLELFTAAQTVNRGLFNTAFIVAAIVVVEEAPEGARAYAVAMLALARGAGAGISTLIHPLADLGPEAWRAAFALHAASILLIPAFARTLPETVRYTALAARVVPTKLGRVR